MAIYGELTNSIIRQINRSRRPITILFTDIEDSTQYWDKHGDIKGRLMVDQHNRLAFPVIRKFKGKIIKTIGDAIMASFKKPEDALKAAIGIQQALREMREQDRSFQLYIRIGLHTGQGIIEHNDVFGDVVNVAARVESQAKGDQILVSGSSAAKVSNKEFFLTKHGSFSPKGKRSEINLYRCQWQKFEDLTHQIRYRAFLPLVKRQKKEILFYALAFIGSLYFLYIKYLRYVLADSEQAALMYLNPLSMLEKQPWLVAGVGLIFAVLVFLLFRSGSIPKFLLHIIKGGFGFAVIFMLAYWPINHLKLDWGDKWNGVLYQSKHLFVHVLEDQTGIYKRPTITSEVIMQAKEGTLLLLSDVKKQYGYAWNKVLIGPGQYGWTERITPRNKRVTITDKFYFRWKDLYLGLISLLGFLWGILEFRVKPS